MNWTNLHEVTAQNEKPAPGWLFRDICQDASQYPQDIPDVAEFLMRSVACESRTVCMKACLTIRHLADEVPAFRQYMQRCPEALAMLKEVSEPPQLAQAQSLERQEAKVAREAAARALRSCLARPSAAKEADAASIKQRIQGFGNFEPPPPPEEQEAPGARGVIDKVAGFVGDAVADTVDDFKEKGAVGAVRDGIADAADLLLDGVGAVWDFLGGRKKSQQAAVVEDRICRPIDERGPRLAPAALPQGGYAQPGATQVWNQAGARPPPAPQPAPNAFQGAFGQGVVGAGYSFSPDVLAPAAPVGAAGFPAPQFASSMGNAGVAEARRPPAAEAAAAPPPAAPVDLLDFEDELSPRSAEAPADLLSFGEASATGSTATAGSFDASAASGSILLKNRGNDLVRQKKHAEAVKAYEAALAALEKELASGASIAGGEQALRATLHANMAMCYLQQQLYRRAVDAATSSIAADATHAKAYYRRCLAHKALKMYSEAKKDLDALQFCKHEMTAAEVQRLHESLAAGLQTAQG